MPLSCWTTAGGNEHLVEHATQEVRRSNSIKADQARAVRDRDADDVPSSRFNSSGG